MIVCRFQPTICTSQHFSIIPGSVHAQLADEGWQLQEYDPTQVTYDDYLHLIQNMDETTYLIDYHIPVAGIPTQHPFWNSILYNKNAIILQNKVIFRSHEHAERWRERLVENNGREECGETIEDIEGWVKDGLKCWELTSTKKLSQLYSVFLSSVNPGANVIDLVLHQETRPQYISAIMCNSGSILAVET
ncbi:putative 28S rRNA (cytosine-C(5))-methyltransferase-like [Homarus americanus]|uniref:Putative 28S rRNA (Cytosine-C(5))-methyltransferase-like n=1 Tax=Homarus americanus TaxID=6706 RepID=A0A8J5K834_HOMAM|nr:putative 28S rRNA (cytosine-C(5))-methyltransferase-like [Homarus americanus]